MKITQLEIEGAWLIESPVHHDDRGFFTEWFKFSEIERQIGIKFVPTQANMSKSSRGVVRGIHYSIANEGQAKVVTVVQGSIVDYVLDLRRDSPSFGKVSSVELSAGSGRSVLISAHLGHAFISMQDDTVISYLVSSEFNPEVEKSINPLASDVRIKWPIARHDIKISDRDFHSPSLKDGIFR